jgi:large subunit ribosomal protein L17
MRHGRTVNHLGRTSSHRKAMLSNMAASLILHKRIKTTVAKAKELKKYLEPMITKAKDDTTHSRRTIFSYLQNKEAVKELFGPVTEKVANRPGGYTRILKTLNRKGDNAEMAIMELVDFNEVTMKDKGGKTAARTRRGRKPASTKATPVADKAAEEPSAE